MLTTNKKTEADEFARHLMAPPYVLHKLKCDTTDKIERKTLLDHNAALKTLDTVHSDAMRYPTQQEVRLWQMMKGKTNKRIVLPLIACAGVAVIAAVGITLAALVGNSDVPSSGHINSSKEESKLQSSSAAPASSQKGHDVSASNLSVVTSKEPVRSNSGASSTSSKTPSSSAAQTSSAPDKNAEYKAKKSALETQISLNKEKISKLEKELAEETEKLENANNSLKSLPPYTAPQVKEQIKEAIADQEKIVNQLQVELEPLQQEDARLKQELTDLAEEFWANKKHPPA